MQLKVPILNLDFTQSAQDDKMSPYLEPFKDKLEELLSPVDIRYLQDEERIYGIRWILSWCFLGRESNYCR